MPDPEPERTKKEWRVAGRNAVLGHKQGETFTAEMTAEEEAFYVDAGHLKEVKRRTTEQGKEE
jgi:hypothetical protein